jgi:hypothetical protein
MRRSLDDKWSDGMSGPEKLFCWNFQTDEGAWEKGWGGYARATNLAPMDERERNTGALYTRTDLIPDPHAIARAAMEAAAICALCQVSADPHRTAESVAMDINNAIRAIINDPSRVAEIVKGSKK